MLQVKPQGVNGEAAEACGFERLLKLLVQLVFGAVDVPVARRKVFGFQESHLLGNWNWTEVYTSTRPP